MTTGIVLERSIEKPFAVSLASGLPEEIRRDDVKALREEYELYMAADAIQFARSFAARQQVSFEYLIKALETLDQIEIQLAQAEAAGFDTKGW